MPGSIVNDGIPAGFTESGFSVYKRTYSRLKPNGERETWEETVRRVVDGNISLVDPVFIEPREADELYDLIVNHWIVPGGRHLSMSGVEGRQFLFNCHLSGWGERLSDHFTFTFLRLMEGGGVGANYSQKYLKGYHIWRPVKIRLYCDRAHSDYEALAPYLEKTQYLGVPRTSWYRRIDDSREGWADAVGNAFDGVSEFYNAHLHGDVHVDKTCGQDNIVISYDLSDIRPSGSPIKTFGGTAAGPVPLARMLKKLQDVLNAAWLNCSFGPTDAMEIDHAIAECVISGNVRRSARMSILHWDDPDIDWFLQCKSSGKGHWSTNISVEIDDEFIKLITEYDQCIVGEDWSKLDNRIIKARKVYRAICEGMLKNGEPGFWNSSLSNIGEDPLNPVIGTNPCGEIPLGEWENCCLGHVNLANMVSDDGQCLISNRYPEAHRILTRFLIRATFADITDNKQRNVVQRNRRIGAGHLGYQWFVNRLGVRYSDSHKFPGIRALLRLGDKVVEAEAASYSRQLRIPNPIKTTAVAPTGTISKMSGVSSGIQPIIAKHFILRIRFSSIDPDQVAQVEEYRNKGYRVVDDIYAKNTLVVEIPSRDPIMDSVPYPELVESQDEISLEDMLSVQAMYQQEYADNGVSFTVNVNEGSVSLEELERVLKQYMPVLKGTTLMVNGSRPLAPYESITEDEYEEYMEFLDDVASVDTFGDGGCTTSACPVK